MQKKKSIDKKPIFEKKTNKILKIEENPYFANTILSF